MERAFKAKKDIILNLVDGDGLIIEEDGFIVPKDSIWYFEYDEDEVISSPVKLISADLNQWIEIEIDDLESGKEFEEVI